VKHKTANFRWTRSSLLASVAVMLFQTDKANCNLDLTKVKYNNNKLPVVEKEKINVRTSPNILSDEENL